MKILVLNGSPKKERSATFEATKAFLEGIKNVNDAEIEYINIVDLKIKPCLGCLSCWGHTPGECILKGDDMDSLRDKILDSDIIVESYPLYFFGMPGIMKVFTDRMMPFMSTYTGEVPPTDGTSYHGIRKQKDGQRLVIISSCAYTNTEVYDSLLKEYDFICGKDNYTAILIPQLKTLIDLKNENKINRYLNNIKTLGEMFISGEKLSKEDIKKYTKPPFTEAGYKVFLNNFWESEKNR